jgi:hypothetical protein
VFALRLLAVSCREHRGSCKRFVVARTSQSFAVAVNRRRFGATAGSGIRLCIAPRGHAWTGRRKRSWFGSASVAAALAPAVSSGRALVGSLEGRHPRFPWSVSAGILAPFTQGRLMHNKPANTDPHLHKAASPLKGVVRLPSR